jgi:hypothetical protein
VQHLPVLGPGGHGDAEEQRLDLRVSLEDAPVGRGRQRPGEVADVFERVDL